MRLVTRISGQGLLVPVSIAALERARQVADVARLSLLVEVETLRGIVAQGATYRADAPATPISPPEESPETPQLAWAREEVAAPELVAWPATEDSELRTELPAGSSSSTPARIYGCKHCGATGLTKSEQMIHGKRHARERRAED
jgi:hypothetical protein